jgi:hypothetical protein
MAPRKNTKSASTPAPVAASNIAKAPTGRKNTTKSASTPAPVAASKEIKVPAGRKNINNSSLINTQYQKYTSIKSTPRGLVILVQRTLRRNNDQVILSIRRARSAFAVLIPQ